MEVLASRQRYEDSHAELPAGERIGGVRIRRYWSTSFGRGSLIGRVFDYASFYVAAFLAVFRHARRGDIVVTATDPPLLGAVAGPAIHLNGACQVNWLHDMFPEIAQSMGVRGLTGRLGGILRLARDRNCRAAARNVVLGRRMSDFLSSRGVTRDKLAVIPNWAPWGLSPYRRENNALCREWGLNGAFVIGYAGNLGRVHESETLLAAAQRLREDRRFVFVVAGGGAQLESLKARAAKLGLRNMLFKPYAPRERLSEALSVADLHVVSLRPEFENFVVPCKIYGIAAVGRPAVFIGDPNGEVAQVLTAHGFGYTVSPGAVDNLVGILERLVADNGECRRLSANARAAHDERFAAAIALSDWECLLSNVYTGDALAAYGKKA